MGLRVLLVEDEALIALNLESLLTERGYVVVGVAANAADALSVAMLTRPELALVDCRLADGDTGLALAGRLRSLFGTVVVAVTAEPHRVPDGDEGVKRVVSKPYTDESIISSLAWAVRQTPAAADHGAGDQL